MLLQGFQKLITKFYKCWTSGIEQKSHLNDSLATTMCKSNFYKTHLWLKHCKEKGQSTTFSGLSAHHQNPIAEKLNLCATEIARTLLLTASLHWWDIANTELFELEDYWSFSLDYAFNLLAKLPIRSEQYCPLDVFSKRKHNAEALEEEWELLYANNREL